MKHLKSTTVNTCEGCGRTIGAGEMATEGALHYLFCDDCTSRVVVTPTNDLQLVLSLN